MDVDRLSNPCAVVFLPSQSHPTYISWLNLISAASPWYIVNSPSYMLCITGSGLCTAASSAQGYP